MGNLTVKRAKHAGACYGVQRALDMTYNVAHEGGRVWTLGPLIHNPRVVSELEEEGIIAANSVDDITEGSVVIRSHGVILSKSLSVVDIAWWMQRALMS